MNLRALAVALVIAALSGTLMILYLRKLEVETSGGAPVRVLMAVKPLEPGMLITDDSIAIRSIPQAYVEGRAIREPDRARIVGLKVETAIKPQQTVFWTDLAVTTDDRRNLSDLVQPGMRAIGIRASAEDQGFALIRPGDRVDVYAVVPHSKDEQERSSVQLAQNLLVLAVGLDMGGEAIGPHSERRDAILTVSAVATQIQQLSLAADRGRLVVVVKGRRAIDIAEGVPELPFKSLLSPEKPRPFAPAPAKPAGPLNLNPEAEVNELQAFRFGAIAVLVGGVSGLSFSALRNPASFTNRSIGRHVERLRIALVRMFIDIDVWPIVIAQAALAFAVVAATMAAHDLRPLLALPIVLFAPSFALEEMRKRRLAKIEAQTDGFVLALSNALRSTASVGDAFRSLVAVVSEPLRSEIELTYKQMQVGSTFEDALGLMGQRIGCRPLDTAIAAILIGQKLGGHLPTTLTSVGSAIRELSRLDREARARLASMRLQMGIIAVAPMVIAIVMEQLQPGFFEPLASDPWGKIAAGIAFVSWGASLVIGRRILQVKV